MNTRHTSAAVLSGIAGLVLVISSVSAVQEAGTQQGGGSGGGGRVTVLRTLPKGAPMTQSQSVQSSQSFMFSENGTTVSVDLRNGEVAHATYNGQDVPADRVTMDNGTLTIRDEQGNVQWQHTLETPGNMPFGGGMPADVLMPRDAVFFHRQLPGGGVGGPDAAMNMPHDDAAISHRQAQAEARAQAQQAAMPKVMIGIQMAEPDAALAGHFGLEPGKATMLSAVYDGLSADKAGLKPFDIIVGVDGKDSASADEIVGVLRSKAAGDSVTFVVLQHGVKTNVTVKLDAFDAQKMEAARLAAGPQEPAMPLIDALPGDWNTPGMPGRQIHLRTSGNAGVGPGVQPFIWNMPVGPGRALVLPPPSLMDMDPMGMVMAGGPGAVGVGAAGGADWAAMNAQMHQRMERMERMLEQLMQQQQQNPSTAPAPSPQSPVTPPANQRVD